MSEFKPGDKVRDADREVTIVTGPFTAHWVRGENGKEEISPVGDLKHIPPTDSRVEAVAKALQYLDDRSFRTWDEISENDKDTYRIDAGHVLAALDETLTAPDRTLRNGDKLRITEDRPHGTGLTTGDSVTVIRANPDEDGDIAVRDNDGFLWHLPATGDDKGWEHA